MIRDIVSHTCIGHPCGACILDHFNAQDLIQFMEARLKGEFYETGYRQN